MDGYGTICGLNQGAADTICRQMGFAGGSVAEGTCSDFRGHRICGSRGMPVAMQQLRCQGFEQEVAECTWTVPDGDCLDHFRDSVIQCHADPTAAAEGKVRLVDAEGHPTQSGFGRLELLLHDKWSPVCRVGFGIGSASVACKDLGFAAVDVNPVLPCTQTNQTRGLCGATLPQMQLLCDGSESDVSKCAQRLGEEVSCAPAENVVLHCKKADGPRSPPSTAIFAASLWPLMAFAIRPKSRRRDLLSFL